MASTPRSRVGRSRASIRDGSRDQRMTRIDAVPLMTIVGGEIVVKREELS